MEIHIQPNHIRTIILSVVVFFLALSSYFGFSAGRDLARSQLALDQTTAVLQSLGYYFADQDRFPSQTEFSDINAFGPYLSAVPLRSIVSKQCPTPAVYDTLNKRTFTFSYCLPRAFRDQSAGRHTVTERDISAGESK